MPKPNETLLILVSVAAKRQASGVMPLPEMISGGGDRAAKSITAPVKGGFAEERQANEAAILHRDDGDIGCMWPSPRQASG